jgi:hypothetical protein
MPYIDVTDEILENSVLTIGGCLNVLWTVYCTSTA